MTALETESGDPEQEIRRLVERRVNAMRNRDARQLVDSISPSAVVFETVPPLRLPTGAATDVEAARAWLDAWEGPVGVEVRDLRIHHAGELAFAYSLNRLHGALKSGRTVNMWIRSTLGLQKIGGSWKIIHSHSSVPFRPDASFKAAVDLRPD